MTTYLCQSYSFESFHRIQSSNKKLRCLPEVVLKRWNHWSEDASSAHSLYTSGPDATLASGMRVMWPHTGRCFWWDEIQNKNNRAIEEFDISVFLFLGVNSFFPQGVVSLTETPHPWTETSRQRPLQTSPWTDSPGQRPPCTVKSIRYASYWNGFLLINCFWRTSVLFVGPLIPLFCTSGDVYSGFQSHIRQWQVKLIQNDK